MVENIYSETVMFRRPSGRPVVGYGTGDRRKLNQRTRSNCLREGRSPHHHRSSTEHHLVVYPSCLPCAVHVPTALAINHAHEARVIRAVSFPGALVHSAHTQHHDMAIKKHDYMCNPMLIYG